FPTAGILQADREVDRARARVRRVICAAFRLRDHLELRIGRTGSYPDCDVVAEGAAVDVAYLDGGKRPSRAEPHQLRARGELGKLGAARGFGALRRTAAEGVGPDASLRRRVGLLRDVGPRDGDG